MALALDARLQAQGWTAQHSHTVSYLNKPSRIVAGFTSHGRAYVWGGAEWVFIGEFKTAEEAWTTLQAIAPLYTRIK